ncbi:MAG TPA: AMP-binding protein [Pyrinomonadaceae bacterium]|nr:AMP-binding protein [Pyrinomonadaceae bacterium]
MTRRSLTSFLDDYRARGEETAFAHRRGLRRERWSYARVAGAAVGFARELEARRIGRGERVLFWSENSAEWVAAFYGCLLRGAVVVPLDVESAPDFVERVRRQTQARMLVHGDDERCRRELPGVERLRLSDLSATVSRYHCAPLQEFEIDERQPAEIIFTSGTTAEPKGVVLTHGNLLANLGPLEGEIKKYLKWERPFHPIRFLNLLPLSHVFGQFMGVFVPALLGGEVYFQQSLNPSETVETTRQNRVSVIVTVPRVLEVLKDKIEREQESRGRAGKFMRALEEAKGTHVLSRWWKFRGVRREFGWKFWAFVSGGATLAAETEEFWQRLGYAVIQGYGMTETASLISVNHPFKQSRGSIGKPLPGHEVRLGEGGEILVRGANVSPGYWDAEAQAPRRNDDWLRTGDIGEMDAAGNLFFRGRTKDVIVTSAGVNVHPADLEAALNAQPEVRESCVVGIETANGPEPVAALILRETSGGAEAAAAIARANRSLGQFQQVRRWIVWAESDFPRTATQKIRKPLVADVVRARLAGALNGRASSGALAETLARVGNIELGGAGRKLDPTATLEADLKLDSLGRVELLSALEDRYQIEIDEAKFTAATTIGDIERVLREGARDEEARPYPRTRWSQRWPFTWLRAAFIYAVALPLVWWMARPRTRGREHLRNLRGPALFVCNHVTRADQALALWALAGRHRRRLTIAMEGELLRDWRHAPPGTHWFKRLRELGQYALVVALFNVFPLPKRSGFRRSFAFAGESVDRGYSVLVFPEGRRSPDGRLQPFMAGAGVLALKLGVPVVPVHLGGLGRLKREDRYFAEPGEVTITVGEPIVFPRDEDAARVAAELERRVAALSS